jgi:hypothetical protein
MALGRVMKTHSGTAGHLSEKDRAARYPAWNPAAGRSIDWPLVRVVNHRQTTAIGRVLTAYFNSVWSA